MPAPPEVAEGALARRERDALLGDPSDAAVAGRLRWGRVLAVAASALVLAGLGTAVLLVLPGRDRSGLAFAPPETPVPTDGPGGAEAGPEGTKEASDTPVPFASPSQGESSGALVLPPDVVPPLPGPVAPEIADGTTVDGQPAPESMSSETADLSRVVPPAGAEPPRDSTAAGQESVGFRSAVASIDPLVSDAVAGAIADLPDSVDARIVLLVTSDDIPEASRSVADYLARNHLAAETTAGMTAGTANETTAAAADSSARPSDPSLAPALDPVAASSPEEDLAARPHPDADRTAEPPFGPEVARPADTDNARASAPASAPESSESAPAFPPSSFGDRRAVDGADAASQRRSGPSAGAFAPPPGASGFAGEGGREPPRKPAEAPRPLQVTPSDGGDDEVAPESNPLPPATDPTLAPPASSATTSTRSVTRSVGGEPPLPARERRVVVPQMTGAQAADLAGLLSLDPARQRAVVLDPSDERDRTSDAERSATAAEPPADSAQPSTHPVTSPARTAGPPDAAAPQSVATTPERPPSPPPATVLIVIRPASAARPDSGPFASPPFASPPFASPPTTRPDGIVTPRADHAASPASRPLVER